MNASRVGPMEVAYPDWIRRFIRGESRGCEVREDRDPIIDPAVDAGFRET